MRSQPRFHSVDHAQHIAKRRVPRSVYRYIEGGTEDEYTVRANRAAFGEVTFNPHAAVLHDRRDTRTTVVGQELALPVVLAPAGYIRLAHRDGEVGAARAAGAMGTAVGVSTLSYYPIEAVAAASTGPVWYQLYFAGGRPGAEIAIDRAQAAGCRALIVTVDLAAAAGRERALRGGVIPQRVTLKNALSYAPELVVRPRWLYDFALDGLRLDVPNVRVDLHGPSLSAAAASRSMRKSAPTWADFVWIRQQWSGPIIIKGILNRDDARRAVDSGAHAIVVSNHGGNALDGTAATLGLLPRIVDAVGADVEVLLDGGIRRGVDAVKAIALGARAVLIGRSYIWGLAAGGSEGVERVLALFKDGIERTLALLGCPSVSELDRSYVDAPRQWMGDK